MRYPATWASRSIKARNASNQPTASRPARRQRPGQCDRESLHRLKFGLALHQALQAVCRLPRAPAWDRTILKTRAAWHGPPTSRSVRAVGPCAGLPCLARPSRFRAPTPWPTGAAVTPVEGWLRLAYPDIRLRLAYPDIRMGSRGVMSVRATPARKPAPKTAGAAQQIRTTTAFTCPLLCAEKGWANLLGSQPPHGSGSLFSVSPCAVESSYCYQVSCRPSAPAE